MKIFILTLLLFNTLCDDTLFHKKDDLASLDILELRALADRLAKQSEGKMEKYKKQYPMPIFMEKDDIIEYIENGKKVLADTQAKSLLFLDPIHIHIKGGVVERLQALDRKKLEAISLAVDQYHRKEDKDMLIGGGIHDYLWRASDDEIRAYIAKELKEHPELDDIAIIESMAKEYEKKDHGIEITQGVRIYLASLDKDHLAKLALGLEKYHRKQTGQDGLIGGLHDYITNLSEDDLRDSIVSEIKCHTEMNQVEQLKAVVGMKGRVLYDDKEFLEYPKIDSLEKAMVGANRERLELILSKLNNGVGNKIPIKSLSKLSEGDLKASILKLLKENKHINLEEIMK
jgi:hypothetical protein